MLAAMTDAPGLQTACPRTGRRRAATLDGGAVRPSDMLVGFFATGIAFFLAAAVAGVLGAVDDSRWLQWIALHLALLGGVSQLVLGAAQFFACAFLATSPPSRRLVRLQLSGWSVAVVLVVTGVPTGIDLLAGLGGVLVVAVVVSFLASLRSMRRRSLQTAPWATRWYVAAGVFLLVGASLGPLMAAGRYDLVSGSMLAAHLTLTIGGWFGTAIVGTLQTFHPSLTGTTLRHPRLQGPVFACWSAGIAVLAVSSAIAAHAGAIAGWALLLAAATMAAVNLVASERAAERRTFAGALVAASQAFLCAGLVAGLVITVSDTPFAAFHGPDRDVVVAALVVGWVALTVAGSLLHLLALMARVRSGFRVAERRAFTRGEGALLALVLSSVLAVIVSRLVGGDAEQLAAAVFGVCAAILAVRLLRVATAAVRAAPLRV